ncbi:MAG TPA: hypothetical protein VHF06_02875 [Pseudonocardiaceae bacterium]|nr:hypothetical protein [Pseudonocardiaceae bacterium]
MRPGWGIGVLVLIAAVGCSSGGDRAALASGPRPADACTLLTSDQVAAIVGTPGPYTGAHEDPAEDGSPVWGCTWGTQLSYADIRELTAKQWDAVRAPDPDLDTTRLSGIGDQALLTKNKDDGGNSYVYFAVGERYYETQVAVDRSGGDDTPNFGHEAEAAQALATMLLPRLSG